MTLHHESRWINESVLACAGKCNGMSWTREARPLTASARSRDLPVKPGWVKTVTLAHSSDLAHYEDTSNHSCTLSFRRVTSTESSVCVAYNRSTSGTLESFLWRLVGRNETSIKVFALRISPQIPFSSGHSLNCLDFSLFEMWRYVLEINVLCVWFGEDLVEGVQWERDWVDSSATDPRFLSAMDLEWRQNMDIIWEIFIILQVNLIVCTSGKIVQWFIYLFIIFLQEMLWYSCYSLSCVKTIKHVLQNHSLYVVCPLLFK